MSEDANLFAQQEANRRRSTWLVVGFIVPGVLVAAFVVEARDTYIYIRDEYPEIRLMLLAEIERLEQACR